MEEAESNGTLQFNPLSWGTLFFSLWLTLWTIGNRNILQEYSSWPILAISVILFLSIVIPPLARILKTKSVQLVLIPLVSLFSFYSFAVTWSGKLVDLFNSVTNGTGTYITFIGVIFGFLWFIAYFMVFIHSISIHNPYLGIFFSVVFITLGIYVLFFETDKFGGLVLFTLGFVFIFVSADIIPVNYPPIFGEKSNKRKS